MSIKCLFFNHFKQLVQKKSKNELDYLNKLIYLYFLYYLKVFLFSFK